MKNPKVTPQFKETWKEWHDRKRRADFNTLAHDISHSPRTFLYTSTKTLSTSVSSRWYPIRGGTLIRCTANVQGAPTSTLTWTVLKNGVSIFATSPTISNESGSFPILDDETEWIDNPVFVRGDYFQVQISVTGGATGPFVCTIEYMPEESVF